jgi:hypothetical protein
VDFDSQGASFVARGQDLSNRVHDSVVVGMEVDIKTFDKVLVMVADKLLKAVFIVGTKKGQRDFVVGIQRLPPDSDDGVAAAGGGGSRAFCHGEAARQQ